MSTHLVWSTMTQCQLQQHLTLQLLLSSQQSSALSDCPLFGVLTSPEDTAIVLVLFFARVMSVVDEMFLQPLLNGLGRRCQKSRASENPFHLH